MESRLSRIEDKIDKLTDITGETKTTMALNTASLQEHIRRTNNLEKQVKPMWTTYKALAFLISGITVVAALLAIFKR